MRTWQKLFALVLVIGMLAGCTATLPAAPAAPAAGDAAAAPAAEAAAPVSTEPLKIGVSIPSADHGWTGGVVYWTERAIADWQAKDPNIEFVLVTADSPETQVSDIEDLLVQEIDGLVVLPYDSASLTPVVKSVKEAGKYVVVIDRGLTESGIEDVYVAGDNPGLGRVSGEWLAEALGGEGDIVVLEGIPTVINTERVEAFNAVIANHPGITILDSQPAMWSTQKGLEIMENYLQKYDKIDAVWAQDDDVLKGVLQAYEESGRDDIKIFLGGAGSKDVVKMIMDGDPRVQADVTYHPSMAATAVSLAVMGMRGQGLDNFYQAQVPSRIILAAELITADNAEQYYEPDSLY